MKWISVHIYYVNDNLLLNNGVNNILQNLIERNILSKFFFIRYFENGPHIRLRLFIPTHFELEVIRFINFFFKDFFEKYPSDRKINYDSYFPNNSIHYIDYHPEVDRYGGKELINMAEEHFYHSSSIVLKLMSKSADWNLSVAQGKAIQLYLIFFKAVSLPKKNIINMLNIMINSHWLQMAQEIIGQDQNAIEIFEKNYLKNKDSLISFSQKWYEILDTEYNQDEDLKSFYILTRHIDNSINSLGAERIILENKQIKDISAKKSVIYISYLHMLNNRLGLKNHDEAYLSYLVKKIIDDII